MGCGRDCTFCGIHSVVGWECVTVRTLLKAGGAVVPSGWRAGAVNVRLSAGAMVCSAVRRSSSSSSCERGVQGQAGEGVPAQPQLSLH